jgi:uncharacterized C2H2 Zn-finger protein
MTPPDWITRTDGDGGAVLTCTRCGATARLPHMWATDLAAAFVRAHLHRGEKRRAT